MDERVLKMRVGLVVLAAAIILSILVMRIGDMPLPGTSKYTIFVRFTRAPGVQVGTPVRKSGISIGRVTDVKLLDEGGVEVRADIDSRRKIYQQEVCHISTASLLGDPVLEFVLGDRPAPGALVLENGNLIDGMVSGNPMDIIVSLEGDLKKSLNTLQGAGEEVKLAARNINTAVANNSDQIPRLMQKAERALDQMNKALSSVDEVFGDPKTRQDFRLMLAEVPALVSEARGTLSKANTTFDSFRVVGERAEQNLANLEAFTKPLADRGPKLVESIDGILGNVNDVTEQLSEFSRGMNSREGTIGRLLHDDTVYKRLDRVLANAEDLTFRIRPIIDDVRVFTDKIARDPRQLGVKGALDRRPLGVGNKLPTTSDSSERPIRGLFGSGNSYESETYGEEPVYVRPTAAHLPLPSGGSWEQARIPAQPWHADRNSQRR